MNLEVVKQIAIEAGKAILDVYNSDNFNIELKGDNSPLTLADKKAHDVIEKGLKTHFPHIPILSEEGKSISHDERKGWSACWIVDPLDGTKEFIKRNGEFTVNIALVENHEPIAGFIYVPVTDVLYFAQKGKGAFKVENGIQSELHCAEFRFTDEGLNLVCSRSHNSPEVEEYLSQFKNPNAISMGSSLKFMLVAEGKAHIYPRLAPTSEWDTCAAQAILLEAGGQVIDQQTQSTMVYTREHILNNHFIAYGKALKS
jgi:3'(2'), 5'-bisphosphate nucleotidase